MDVFCYSPDTGYRFKGRLWPGPSYYPDFFHPNASEYWGHMIEVLHKKTNFTGLWLDVNEPANFISGEGIIYNDPSLKNQTQKHLNPHSTYPYMIGGRNKYLNINHKSLRNYIILYKINQ